jgi:GT2 family glycosyltransferase
MNGAGPAPRDARLATRELIVAAADPDIEVTVIIPARDAATTLPGALACLTQQGFAAAAVQPVVVDDGSGDATASVASAGSAMLPQLTLLRHEAPLGPAAARNTGLTAARGRLVAFLDADDWFGPGHLASLATALDTMGASFVKSDHVLATGRRRELRRAPEARRGIALNPREGILPAGRTTMVDYPNLPTGLYRRDLLEAGLLWLPEAVPTAEDRAWTWRLFLEAPSYGVVDAAGMFYRRGNPHSLTSAFDERRFGYLAAARWVAACLAADPEGDRFLPKLVDQTLVLTGFHRARRRHFPRHLRKRLVVESAEVLAGFPGPVVAAQIDALPAYRARLLMPVLRAYRKLTA